MTLSDLNYPKPPHFRHFVSLFILPYWVQINISDLVLHFWNVTDIFYQKLTSFLYLVPSYDFAIGNVRIYVRIGPKPGQTADFQKPGQRPKKRTCLGKPGRMVTLLTSTMFSVDIRPPSSRISIHLRIRCRFSSATLASRIAWFLVVDFCPVMPLRVTKLVGK